MNQEHIAYETNRVHAISSMGALSLFTHGQFDFCSHVASRFSLFHFLPIHF